MGFDIKKFFGGFAFWQGEVFGKLLYYFIIVSIVLAIAFGIYKKFVQPTHSNPQKAGTIINYITNNNCKALLGWKCGK